MTPAAVRQAIAAALEAAGWTPSPMPGDLFGLDSRHLAHRAFSVWVSSSSALPEDRQRFGASAVTVTSSVTVRFLAAIKADAPTSSTDAALDLEVGLVRTVLGIENQPMDIRLDGVTSRAVVADGTFYRGEVRFLALHRYPLRD